MRRIRLPTLNHVTVLRGVLISLGCAAVWWGLVAYKIVAKESLIERIANRIVAGEPYKLQTLAQQLPTIYAIESSEFCQPLALRSAAIIQLRLLELNATADGHETEDKRLRLLIEAIDRSLSCEPADPFLWLVLFRMKNVQDGTNFEYLNLLRLSYQFGKNEGWVAVKRNYIAFSMFRQLPPDLAGAAIEEFVRLVESKLFDKAQEIFIGPAWPERGLILQKLASIQNQDRQYFIDVLRKHGYDINVPGATR